MNTVKLQNKIVIENPENFKAKDTLECGQFFRYFLRDDGSYLVYSTDKKAEIFEYGDKTEIVTSDVDYFENFFDLGRDYSVFEKKYQNIPFLKNALMIAATKSAVGSQPISSISCRKSLWIKRTV